MTPSDIEIEQKYVDEMQIFLQLLLSSLPQREKALNLSDFNAPLNISEVGHERSELILLLNVT